MITEYLIESTHVQITFHTPAPYMKQDNLYLKRLNDCISMLPASSGTKMDALIEFSIPKNHIRHQFCKKNYVIESENHENMHVFRYSRNFARSCFAANNR